MNIYVVRHGETDYNLEGRFQGRKDIDLNENGINQVKLIKEEISQIDFDIVFVSPLKRAIHTLEILEQRRYIIDKRIIERSFGLLEGKKSIRDYEQNVEKYKIEPLNQVKNRVFNFLDEILKKYSKMNNILIITHEAVAQNINLYFNKETKKIKDFRLETGKYVKYIV